jgi:hypothetical protein
MRLKANVGARLIDEMILDIWSEDLIVMMVAGAFSNVVLADITTCEGTIDLIFPGKEVSLCASQSFNPFTLRG